MRLCLDDAVAERVELVSFPLGITLAAWLGGLRPGLVATGLHAVACWATVFVPRGSDRGIGPGEIVALLAFAAMGTWISVACEGMHAARERAEAAERRAAASAAEVDEHEALVEALLGRKRAESEAAARKTAELEAVLASMTEGILITDPTGNVVDANPAALALYGYESVEQVRRAVKDLLPHWEIRDLDGRLVPLDRQPVARALAGERFTDLELRVRGLGTGRDFIGSYSGTPMRDGRGGRAGALIVVRDVSEQKRAELLLRASEENAQRQLAELRATYATAPVGLCVLDRDLRCVRTNERMADLVGTPSSKQLGKTMRELVPEVAGALEPMLRDVLATGKPQIGVELTGRTAASPGIERTWLASHYPLRDERGAVIGINVVCQEITERKRQEAALREATELAEHNLAQLEAVIASLHEGLAIIDEDDTTLSMNERGLRIWGVESVDGVRKAVAFQEAYTLEGALVPPSHWPLARIREGEAIEGLTLRIQDGRTGSEQFIAYGGGPVLDGSGRRIAGVLTFQDVTVERRAAIEREALLESERAARAEAERANRMKDECLAILSHELRTPLSSILGWASLLRRPNPTPAQIEKGLGVIERNSRLLSQLMSDLLDVSRIVWGKLHVDLVPIPIATSVEAAVEGLRSTAAAKGVELVEAIAPVEGTVLGDPARIQQVVSNLLSNAIKFTPRGGRVQVAVAQRGDRVEIAVQDTGKGITPEFLPHVFDRFRQADASTTREHGGLGLGLAIVKSLVGVHGGSVRAESAGPGTGSTFTVELACSPGAPLALPVPVSRDAPDAGGAEPASSMADADSTREGSVAGNSTPPPPLASSHRAAPMSLAGICTLLVEDEADTREILGCMLEEHGATVIAAASGEEALGLLAVRAVDVLLSDIAMPGMDGYALVKAVRASGARLTRELPAIALTAFARAEDRQRALAAGYHVHLTKPVAPAELVAAVARLAASRAPREEAAATI